MPQSIIVEYTSGYRRWKSRLVGWRATLAYLRARRYCSNVVLKAATLHDYQTMQSGILYSARDGQFW